MGRGIALSHRFAPIKQAPKMNEVRVPRPFDAINSFCTIIITLSDMYSYKKRPAPTIEDLKPINDVSCISRNYGVAFIFLLVQVERCLFLCLLLYRNSLYWFCCE